MLILPAGAGALERVRSEGGRLWVECGNGSLSEVLRDIAAGKETAGDTTTLEDYAVLAKLRGDEE